jgi:23S rRNA (guanosine2251-2'-O)-methyltransferase
MGKRFSAGPTKAAKAGLPHFWGRHAVYAALDNPDRVVRRIWGTKEALDAIVLPPAVPVQYCGVADLGRLVPSDAPHQGLVIEVEPLEDPWLDMILESAQKKPRPILVLDQVTDPHNLGAILRSAAAFNALAVITQDRHSPPESGVVARAASGALEMVPWLRVVNLARTLDQLAEADYWRIGLAGEVGTPLSGALGPARVALVLGAEGAGMRHNIAEHCDQLARLPIHPRMESLNVSNAAAIALYAMEEARRKKGETE